MGERKDDRIAAAKVVAIALYAGIVVGACSAEYEQVGVVNHDRLQVVAFAGEGDGLACGDDFQSDWIGNRRCKPCTSSRAYQTEGSAMI